MCKPSFNVFTLDKALNYDRIIQQKALMELSLLRIHEREGTVRALEKADKQATPEQPAKSRTVRRRYRTKRVSLP